MKPIKFDGEDVKRLVMSELDISGKFYRAFEYVLSILVSLGHFMVVHVVKPLDLSTIKWWEGKNYKWAVLINDDTRIVIRQYGAHFTIYVKYLQWYGEGERRSSMTKIFAFTFNTSRDKLSGEESDMLIDNPFLDINQAIHNIFELVNNDKAHQIRNSRCFVRPERCTVKEGFKEREIIHLDIMIFALEEITSLHNQLYSEHYVYGLLQGNEKLLIGQEYNRGTITEVKTELKDEYYHSIGIAYIKNDKREFDDVYSISEWHMESFTLALLSGLMKK